LVRHAGWEVVPGGGSSRPAAEDVGQGGWRAGLDACHGQSVPGDRVKWTTSSAAEGQLFGEAGDLGDPRRSPDGGGKR
jgi:hypothetical protein